MVEDHDRESAFLDRASGREEPPSPPPPAATPDPLSDVLRTVRLTGALFFMVDATSPWCVDVPEGDAFSRIILPRSQHVISYHVVVEGAGLASVPGATPVEFSAGDIVVFPHADPYLMQSAPDVPPELDTGETLEFFRQLAAGSLPFVVTEGGGKPPPARFVCGFLGCDARPFNPLLRALPRLIHVRRRVGDEEVLSRLVDLTLVQARASGSGGECVRLGLSELLFVEAVRRYLDTLPSGAGGWLAGLRDEVVGRALECVHGRPAAPWTLDTLAREIGTSRSVLAERFTQSVGLPPMQYLTGWRMQIAARMLSEGKPVSAIALEVGYSSESAFSRGFKRIAGVAPSAWRKAANA